jgi:NitT/TauT family transport system substrate-binding protein
MTKTAKILLTVIILAGIGFGAWRWKDKLAPAPVNQTMDQAAVKQQIDAQKAAVAAQAAPAAPDITGKLLAGTNAAALVSAASLPPVQGTSDYDRPMKNGRLVVQFPINVWPGWAPIIVANNGLDPNDDSWFYKHYGFYVKLAIVDDPIKARDLFASGHSHVLWGTLDMIALFAPALCADSRTVPIVAQQVDWSQGGDGIVVRGNIRSINDFRPVNGIRKKVVLAQNSPSHYFFMSVLLDANIDPATIDFKWAADAPSAAKIFVQDNSFDAFVGWSPDIYTVSDGVPGTRIVLSSASANHALADVWAVRNDFYRDHPDIVKNLVRGIFAGMDMVRRDPTNAATILSQAFSIPVDDCKSMIGKDGGISSGDAHLTNYRENSEFFLDPLNPSCFENVFDKASTIYKSLGAIDNTVEPGKVKGGVIIASLAAEYKDVIDLSQPTFKPGALFKNAEATTSEILTKSVIIKFEPNSDVLNTGYDLNIPGVLTEVGKMAGTFGNAYIVIEGNTDASKKGLVPADLVKQLSYDRANAVKKALLVKYPNFNPDKFKVIGNGWDNPLPGLSDATSPENNARNRRVEVKVYPLEE